MTTKDEKTAQIQAAFDKEKPKDGFTDKMTHALARIWFDSGWAACLSAFPAQPAGPTIFTKEMADEIPLQQGEAPRAVVDQKEGGGSGEADVDPGVRLIERERIRQRTVEGWSASHDDEEHSYGALAKAGALYAMESYWLVVPDAHKLNHGVPENWPWDYEWWKPSLNPIRNLVKAGALIAAEIDRLIRGGIDPDADPKHSASAQGVASAPKVKEAPSEFPAPSQGETRETDSFLKTSPLWMQVAELCRQMERQRDQYAGWHKEAEERAADLRAKLDAAENEKQDHIVDKDRIRDERDSLRTVQRRQPISQSHDPIHHRPDQPTSR